MLCPYKSGQSSVVLIYEIGITELYCAITNLTNDLMANVSWPKTIDDQPVGVLIFQSNKNEMYN